MGYPVKIQDLPYAGLVFRNTPTDLDVPLCLVARFAPGIDTVEDLRARPNLRASLLLSAFRTRSVWRSLATLPINESFMWSSPFLVWIQKVPAVV